jgi:hypothetical protein
MAQKDFHGADFREAGTLRRRRGAGKNAKTIFPRSNGGRASAIIETIEHELRRITTRPVASRLSPKDDLNSRRAPRSPPVPLR